MDLFVHVYIKFVKKYLFFIDTFIRNLWAATDLFTSLFTVAFISRKLSRSPYWPWKNVSLRSVTWEEYTLHKICLLQIFKVRSDGARNSQ